MEQLLDLQSRIMLGLGNVSRQIPLVLAAPRENPREAMILALAVSLMLVLLVMIGFVAVDAVGSTARRRRLGVRRRHPVNAVWLLMAVGVIGSVGTVLALAPLVPGAGSSCAVCHAIAEPVEQWEQGSHAKVACFGCHAQPGVLGALQASSGGLAGLVGGTRSGQIPSASCLNCHENIRVGVVELRGLRVQHAEMIDAGMDCMLCHAGTGHSDVRSRGATVTETAANPGGVTAERSRMARCTTCHDDDVASADCDTCHVSGSVDRVVGVWDGLREPTPVTCKGCHAPATTARCIDCHGLELPHPPPFMSDHAGLSQKAPALCATCHGPTARADNACACHEDGTTHGAYADWFPRHAGAAAANWPGGCNCHSSGFCVKCHDSAADRAFFIPSL